MSRDQRPGKIKLVSTAAGHAPHHERFEEGHEDPATAIEAQSEINASPQAGFLLPVLFLISCAIGGACAVYLSPMIG
ncbi:hypothetical protein [Erythrobacter aureus]|uniref:Uncharacterized protein n=1 Tax=Erythrobacter aureus TaxID=2182384 RepID=A0A345YJN5_9SPHN|nr:hypothetical protein [Erythrobacter aureus]AXK44137.1 hypothetical protein DVR09_16935 [Erythrobacter aureus]